MTARLWSWIAGVALILAFLAGLYAWGRADGREAQREDDAALVARKDAALRAAATALGAAATRFREIDALGAAAEAQAQRDADEAAAAVKAAAAERESLTKRIAAISAAAARDTSPCRAVSTEGRLQ